MGRVKELIHFECVWSSDEISFKKQISIICEKRTFKYSSLASLLWRCDPLWRQCIRSIQETPMEKKCVYEVSLSEKYTTGVLWTQRWMQSCIVKYHNEPIWELLCICFPLPTRQCFEKCESFRSMKNWQWGGFSPRWQTKCFKKFIMELWINTLMRSYWRDCFFSSLLVGVISRSFASLEKAIIKLYWLRGNNIFTFL